MMNPTVPVRILPVAFDYGAGRGGAAAGPEALLQAGLAERLAALGRQAVRLPRVPAASLQADFRSAPGMKHWGRVLGMAEETAAAAAAAADGGFPLILGGDHSIAIGTIAGLASRRQRLGVLWIDAHSDLNTPYTTPSGNLHGMSLAACLGFGDPHLAAVGGYSPKLQPERIALVGARSLDKGEREIIGRLGIACFTMHDIDRRGMADVMKEAIAIVSNGSDGVHLSFDIDSVDPGEAPGTGTPVRGGLSYREAHLAMELLHEAGILTSAELVEVNPRLDSGNRTARLAVELLASLFGEKIL